MNSYESEPRSQEILDNYVKVAAGGIVGGIIFAVGLVANHDILYKGGELVVGASLIINSGVRYIVTKRESSRK